MVSTSDADISAAFNTAQVAVTLDVLSDIKAKPAVTEVFNSSQIPGEIAGHDGGQLPDPQDNPALGKALTGAWFEVVELMNARNAASKARWNTWPKPRALRPGRFPGSAGHHQVVRHASRGPGVQHQQAIAGNHAQGLEFSFQHGLLGEGAKDTSAVGMGSPTA